MFSHTSNSALMEGFSAALMIPAAASTLKQAQREAADQLHLLADHYRAVCAGRAPADPGPAVREAIRRFGQVLVEQGINGTAFFLVVKLAVLAGGAYGGMLAQVCITGNTIITPHQTQKFNPAQTLFSAIGSGPDWVPLLPQPLLRALIHGSGAFADWCGYGRHRTLLSPSEGASRSLLSVRQRQPGQVWIKADLGKGRLLIS